MSRRLHLAPSLRKHKVAQAAQRLHDEGSMPLPPFLATAIPRALLVCGGAAAVAGVGLTVYSVVSARPAPAPVCLEIKPTVIAPPVVAEPPKPVLSSEVRLAFTADGASYVKLAEVGNRASEDGEPARTDGLAMPRHGAARLVEDDYVRSSVATVAVSDVPMMYASWLGRRFRIDEHCEASVVGFAVVARLTGEPSYAAIENEAWTASNVMKAGQPVLAAKLDGCKGTLARDAALSPIVFPDVRHDAALEDAARDALLRSKLAAETQREWDVQRQDDHTVPATWTANAELTAKVLRHPTTGKTFVSVQLAVASGCGAPEANIWALYEQTDGGLRPVVERKMSDIQTIDQLVDIDGDGSFEMVGSPWINNEQVILRPSGERLESLATQFYGCPC